MLLVQRFTGLIENHAESLSKRWAEEVLSNDLTAGYRSFSRQELHDIVFSRFRTLGEWLSRREGHDRELSLNFCKIGGERHAAGIKSSDMVYSFMIEREMLMSYVQEEGIITEGIDLRRALEFTAELSHFYDKAIYFALVGYEEAALKPDERRSETELDKTFEGFGHWLIRE
ncbi:hypothetical protein [Prosthecochloris sp. CIB 2401]|uniref:hypothetical protein n=1 Tax=Prosthecochloris sp. CIB 2401 TaxID=1868325 RepID=UPI00080A95CF|nr:hypothetical protein [Prosthecochloris sp. CIB 2401]ANT65888.1 hypothetical protein Ptc2401_02159 [Prosthecochloris sp. CIB 2401]